MNNNINVRGLVSKTDIISGMMTYEQVIAILENLKTVILNEIPGDIVELGCNVGTTTMHMQRLLDAMNSDKIIHVYDSWEGLPEKTKHDISNSTATKFRFNKGSCKTSKDIFIQTFKSRNLKLPVIHSGWFSKIPDIEYPEKICFAFFDGDFYNSIIDSFNKTYNKVQKGGIFIIDDCGWSPLPGVEKACLDFLKDKQEKLDLTGYPDNNGIYGNKNGGGKIIKL